MHSAGIEARKLIWESQDIIARKLNCNSEDIYFTTGATMSNNLLIQGVLRKQPETMFITSMVEHNDIMELYDWLPYSKGFVNVNKNGIIDLSVLENNMSFCKEWNKPILVSIQMANSETGVIQPIKQISELVHAYGGYLHTDATQFIPYYPINMDELEIDALSMSGQKIGGIKGSGLLVVRQEMRDIVSPIIFGEQGLIGGTPSTPLIASLAEAFELLDYDNSDIYNKTQLLINNIKNLGGIIIGDEEDRLPNNVFCRFPGIKGMTILNLLNDRGIYIGTGSACSTDSDKPSHVALAYGLTEEEAFECIRFTLGNTNSYSDVNIAMYELESILKMLK